MTSQTLAQSYLRKARARLRVLDVLLEEEAYSDIVREAQEIVELALKGILRWLGIEPPKQHDVSFMLREYRHRLPRDVESQVDKLAEISHWLRKEREFSFYGDTDFIPTEEYDRPDADQAIADARFVVEMASRVIN